MRQNMHTMGTSIPLGDFGSLNLSNATTGNISNKVNNFLPGWLSDIFTKKPDTPDVNPKMDPAVIGMVAVGGIALIALLAASKKGGRRAPVRRRRRR